MTVPMQFPSAVTERDQDAFVGSSMDNGTTVLQFDRRQHDLHQAWGTKATRCWRKESSPVDVHALSTFHHPMLSRFIVAQGASLNDQPQRVSCTPESQGVSPSQPRRHSVIRLACSLAVVCGVSLRHMARLFAVLCLMPMTKSSIKRWLDDLGAHLPPPEARLRQLLALAPATACPSDGSDPLGTDHGVMVVPDAHDRILSTHETVSAHGADARQLLQPVKDLGLHVTAAFSDDAHSFTAALKAVFPHARLQADPCHTVKHLWGHRKQSLLASRRKGTVSGTAQNDAHLLAVAKQLWQLRWRLLKQPANLSGEDKQAMAALEREDAGFVHRFRSMIRQLVQIVDHAQSAAQAKSKLTQLRQAINAVDDDHLHKMLPFFDDHGEQALRYLRTKGMGKHRRGSNAESGMRLLRR